MVPCTDFPRFLTNKPPPVRNRENRVAIRFCPYFSQKFSHSPFHSHPTSHFFSQRISSPFIKIPSKLFPLLLFLETKRIPPPLLPRGLIKFVVFFFFYIERRENPFLLSFFELFIDQRRKVRKGERGYVLRSLRGIPGPNEARVGYKQGDYRVSEPL